MNAGIVSVRLKKSLRAQVRELLYRWKGDELGGEDRRSNLFYTCSSNLPPRPSGIPGFRLATWVPEKKYRNMAPLPSKNHLPASSSYSCGEQQVFDSLKYNFLAGYHICRCVCDENQCKRSTSAIDSHWLEWKQSPIFEELNVSISPSVLSLKLFVVFHTWALWHHLLARFAFSAVKIPLLASLHESCWKRTLQAKKVLRPRTLSNFMHHFLTK